MCKLLRPSIFVLVSSVFIAGCSGSRHESVAVRQASDRHRSAGWAPAPHAAQDPASDSGIVFGFVTPTDPRYAMTLDEVKEHARNNTAMFIDARGQAAFALGHVRGAVNMPPGEKEAYLPKVREQIAPDQLVIIYCSSPHCESSDMIYEYLAAEGYNNMRIFKPGWQSLAKVSELR